MSSKAINVDKDGVQEGTFYVPDSFLAAIWPTIQQNGFLGAAAKFVQYRLAIQKFLKGEPDDSVENVKIRKEIFRRFNIIDKNVKCGHYPYQFLLMAEYVLNLKVPGPIVECGAFKGGSSAKLSVLAEITGRQLYVCDSFEGLPAPKLQGEEVVHGLIHKDYKVRFLQGECAGKLEEVRDNITKYGCIEKCEFVKGYFENSLVNLDVTPAFVFIDVDFVSSARDCLKNLWPRLKNGGLWFTHEASFTEYVYGMMDGAWWLANLQQSPPLMIGAGTGLSPLAEAIAYIKKE